MALAAEKDMARKKGRPKTGERKESTARMDATILAKVKMIAIHRGLTVSDLLSELLASPVDRAYAQVLRELDERGGKP